MKPKVVKIPRLFTHDDPIWAVRWLLKFWELDLARLSPADIEKVGLEAHAFSWGTTVCPPPPVKFPLLQRFHGIVQTIFSNYKKKEDLIWRFKVEVQGQINWVLDGTLLKFSLMTGGSPEDVFSSIALHAIDAVGDRLRECSNSKCQRLFVSEGRMTYCSRTCSDRVRQERFLDKLAKDPKRLEKARKRRRAAYASKVRRAKSAPNLKVGLRERRPSRGGT